jgi:hypothetical protein
MPSERFMKQHYGASGFVDRKAVKTEVGEDARVAVAKYCHERDLNYTLGTMLEMARFAEQYAEQIAKCLRLTQEAAGKAEIRAIVAERARQRASSRRGR